MTTKDPDSLYKQAKPDIEAIAQPLFHFSEQCLRKIGNFLPHGAVLTTKQQVELVGAMPKSKDGYSTSVEVLPVLHDAIRKQAMEKSILAVGVAENVTITPQGESTTRAVKVLVEHQCGLTVALYLPFRKKLFRRLSFGEIFSIPAQPEVKIWHSDAV